MQKKRHPLLAAFLSLLLPGLGQLYNAQRTKALIFFGTNLVLWCVMELTSFLSSVTGFVTWFSLGILLALASIVDAGISAWRLGEVLLEGFNRVYVYILVLVGFHVTTAAGDIATSQFFGDHRSYSIPAGSMMPTIEIGEVIWTGPISTSEGALRRGEIIVFAFPHDETKDFIKRIAGLPGDVLELREGRLYVNGTPVPRCLLGEQTYSERNALTGETQELSGELFAEHLDGRTYLVLQTQEGESWGPERVPAGQVYVLGDNRDNSHDSRRWAGLPLENIRARSLFRLYSRTAGASWNWDVFGKEFDEVETLDETQLERLRQCQSEGFPN